jgi:hypothetical protein
MYMVRIRKVCGQNRSWVYDENDDAVFWDYKHEKERWVCLFFLQFTNTKPSPQPYLTPYLLVLSHLFLLSSGRIKKKLLFLNFQHPLLCLFFPIFLNYLRFRVLFSYFFWKNIIWSEGWIWFAKEDQRNGLATGFVFDHRPSLVGLIIGLNMWSQRIFIFIFNLYV